MSHCRLNRNVTLAIGEGSGRGSAPRQRPTKTWKPIESSQNLSQIMIFFAQKVEHYKAKLEEAKFRAKECDSARKSEAYIYAKQAIRPQLKSPRSAKFGSYGQTDITHYQDCSVMVKGFVDAQNGFGALIRSHYNVHLKHSEAGWIKFDRG